jgi:Family of unknown function (DUF6279)
MHRLPDEDLPHSLRQRVLRWALIGAVTLVLAACSVLQLVYDQAPRYVQWRTNVAHHFTEDQQELVRPSIRRWFEWHRREQMPQVARLLQQAALDVRHPISPELACERRDAYLAMSKQAFAAATPLAAAVMVHLGPSQVSRVQAFFEDLNDEHRDKYTSDDPREQAGLAVDFIEEWGGLVYGDFSAAQREHLVRKVMDLPFSARTVLQELQRFQGRYVQLLQDTQAQKLPADQVSQRLLAMLLDGVDPQEPVRKAQMQRWVKAGCAFASDLHAQTTLAQRERAERTLTAWREDVQDIVGQR